MLGLSGAARIANKVGRRTAAVGGHAIGSRMENAMIANPALKRYRNNAYTGLGAGVVGAGVALTPGTPSSSNSAASRANQNSYVLQNIRRHSASGLRQNLQPYSRSIGGFA